MVGGFGDGMKVALQASLHHGFTENQIFFHSPLDAQQSGTSDDDNPFTFCRSVAEVSDWHNRPPTILIKVSNIPLTRT